MKYIIELSEEVKEKFDNATKDDIFGSYYDYNSVIGNAIKNGTSLEEHGRLIDADVLCDYFWDNRSKLFTQKDLQIVIDRQPTIIEADVIEKLEEIKTEMDIIAELEAIKAEIQEMRNDNPSYYYTCDVIEREKLLDLLDEHISELKGENEQ